MQKIGSKFFFFLLEVSSNRTKVTVYPYSDVPCKHEKKKKKQETLCNLGNNFQGVVLRGKIRG